MTSKSMKRVLFLFKNVNNFPSRSSYPFIQLRSLSDDKSNSDDTTDVKPPETTTSSTQTIPQKNPPSASERGI